MALVDYSESDSNPPTDEEANSPPPSSCRKRSNWHNNHSKCESPRTKRKRSSADSTGTTTTSPPPLPASPLLPALPQTFHSLYATSVRTSIHDDPTLHSGRTRQTPHINGNWPTHIYLEWYPSATELTTLTHLITSSSTSASIKSHSLVHSSLLTPLPLHISLSASLVLKTAQKPPFLDSLEQGLSSSNIRPFTLTTGALDWAFNRDKTRRFLVLRVRRPEGNGLNRLLWICNEVVGRFGQPLLYRNQESGVAQEQGVEERGNSTSGSGLEPRRRPGPGAGKSLEASTSTRNLAANAGVPDRSDCFHVSIAWTLQDPGGGGDSSDLTQIPGAYMDISFDVVKVKIGNAVHDVPLGKSAATST